MVSHGRKGSGLFPRKEEQSFRLLSFPALLFAVSPLPEHNTLFPTGNQEKNVGKSEKNERPQNYEYYEYFAGGGAFCTGPATCGERHRRAPERLHTPAYQAYPAYPAY